MKYLDRLRESAGKKVFANPPLPTKLTKPPEGTESALTKLTEPTFVSFAGAPPPPKTFAGLNACELEAWRAPLVLSRLVACANCAHFTSKTDPNGTGTCRLHGDGLLPFLPFDCREFLTATAPAAPAYLPVGGGTA